MVKSLFGFPFDYETDLGKNYLVFTKEGPGSNRVIDFQVEMIANNNIPGIVNMAVREKDAETKFYYELNGLVTLANYFKKQKISELEFFIILDRLISTLLKSKNYFLNESSFILDDRFIYIDSKSREVFLIYLPVEIPQDITQSCKALVVNLLINTSCIESWDSFVQRILNLIRTGDFNLIDFSKQLKVMKDDFSNPVPYHKEEIFEAVEPPVPDKHIIKPVSKLSPGKLVPKLSLRKLVLIILAGISVSAAVISSSTGSFGGVWNRLAGSGCIPAAGITVVLVLLFAPLYLGKIKKTSPESQPQQSVYTEQPLPVIDSYNSEETVFLEEADCPFLKAVNGDETIMISKSEFILGRNPDTCDYAIQNKGVGRAHAQIKNVNGSYFIVDLDSTNGTFINGSKVVANKQYELKDNDKISLASMDYCFMLK